MLAYSEAFSAKMKKKVLVVMLSIALAMATLSGCGKSGGREMSDSSSEKLSGESEVKKVTVSAKEAVYNPDGSVASWYEIKEYPNGTVNRNISL